MAVVAIVSVLVVGIYNLVTARDFLNSTVEAQLVSVGESRMERLERGVESIGDDRRDDGQRQGCRTGARRPERRIRCSRRATHGGRTRRVREPYTKGASPRSCRRATRCRPLEAIFPESDERPVPSVSLPGGEPDSRIDPSWMMPATARSTAPPMRSITPR